MRNIPVGKAVLFMACFILVERGFGQEVKTRPPKAGDVQIEKRKFRMWSGTTGEYEFGTFFVKENRSDPNSRIISINFSRFTSPKPQTKKGRRFFFCLEGPADRSWTPSQTIRNFE